MAKYPLLQLKSDNYEIDEPEPRERRIIEGKINIDRSVFKKSKKERELLKLAKMGAKIELMNKYKEIGAPPR